MINKPKIPRCMSTQHPDNATLPFFSQSTELSGEDEIQEAYYAFSRLSCDEQMWDCEGKEVDNFIVKKLLTKYGAFFKKKRLGKDVFITLRVPNPAIEKAEAKILLETLESIPRSFDTAKLFYQDNAPPIFEVILPMATSPESVDRIYRYYRDFVIGKQNKSFIKGDITIAQWIGEFRPEKINVIPLFEDMEHMLSADNITRLYLKEKDIEYQRIFLARSDPAMNYGLISAILLNKIALKKLDKLSKEIGIELCPIIGVGSAPFRGNFRPDTAERTAREYPSVYTFTIQSAFKYDNSSDKVRKALEKLKQIKISSPHEIDEQMALKVIKKYTCAYQKQIMKLVPVINKIARHMPSRRKRKLHIGLFGYSRNLGKTSLPRAIPFTAALYSIGLAPEILGLDVLDKKEIKFVQEVYLNFENDLRDSLRYLNPNTNFLSNVLKTKIKNLSLDFQIDREHKRLTDYIVNSLEKNKTEDLEEYILKAGSLRRFLG